jgi:hypothetical protein
LVLELDLSVLKVISPDPIVETDWIDGERSFCSDMPREKLAILGLVDCSESLSKVLLLRLAVRLELPFTCPCIAGSVLEDVGLAEVQRFRGGG